MDWFTVKKAKFISLKPGTKLRIHLAHTPIGMRVTNRGTMGPSSVWEGFERVQLHWRQRTPDPMTSVDERYKGRSSLIITSVIRHCWRWLRLHLLDWSGGRGFFNKSINQLARTASRQSTRLI